jgi:hypothetical protein
MCSWLLAWQLGRWILAQHSRQGCSGTVQRWHCLQRCCIAALRVCLVVRQLLLRASARRLHGDQGGQQAAATAAAGRHQLPQPWRLLLIHQRLRQWR